MFSLVSFSIGPCADRRGKHVAGWPWDSILCGRRLQKEANKHRAVAAAAAQDASAVKRARFEATVDAAQLARFQAALGDGLLFGMVGLSLAPLHACFP